MESDKKKPVCEFGAACYRKNPNHRQTYWHPKDDEATKTKSPNAKRVKLASPETKQELQKQTSRQTKQTTLNFTRKVSPARDKVGGKVQHTKQTTLNFARKAPTSEKPEKTGHPTKNAGLTKPPLDIVRTKIRNFPEKQKSPGKCVESSGDNSRPIAGATAKSPAKNTKPIERSPTKHVVSESEEESSDDEAPTQGWVVKTVKKQESATAANVVQVNTPQEAIKVLYLVDMPADFYDFYEFSKRLNEKHPLNVLKDSGVTLVGPFEVLAGNIEFSNIKAEGGLCHWRYYYDPPEFQTVLAGDKGFHIGYWRDEPASPPVLLASNNATKGCVFRTEGENIFAAVCNYLSALIKTCDPFLKIKMTKLLSTITEEAIKLGYSVELLTENIRSRQKRVVTKTLHQLGIVVPVEAKTELGYRPLIVTEANLKQICTAIMKSESAKAWEPLESLITAANIANDECDFGNSLELGIDLFCMGSSVFHETVQHLLSTAYSLLNRTEFEKVICAHLNQRAKQPITKLA